MLIALIKMEFGRRKWDIKDYEKGNSTESSSVYGKHRGNLNE